MCWLVVCYQDLWRVVCTIRQSAKTHAQRKGAIWQREVRSKGEVFGSRQSAPLWSRLKYLTVEWFATEFSTDIHGTHRMNPEDFSDPLVCYLV